MWNFYRLVWFASVFAIAALAGPMRVQAESGAPLSVVFSEVAWAGSSMSNADEWIELYNTREETVDMSGWIVQGAATGGGDLTIPDTTIIQPHSTFLIANYATTHDNSALRNEPDVA